jgi:hypothetical protein
VYQFRDNADGDFPGSLRADGQSDGAVYTVQIMLLKPLFNKSHEYFVFFPSASDHSDIWGIGFQGLL